MTKRDYNLTTYQPAIEEPTQQANQAERDRAHLFTPAAGVILPILQAITTGAILGAAAAVYAWLLKSPQAWRWGVGVAIGVTVIAWLLMLARWLDLTRPLERLINRDLDRDGIIGKPPRPETIRVAVTTEDRQQTTIAELPKPEKLRDFARGVLAGDPISERHWSGAGALFSQAEFRQVRDEFIARGWLRWNNPEYPQQGLTLAPGGRAALRALANHPTPAERDA